MTDSSLQARRLELADDIASMIVARPLPRDEYALHTELLMVSDAECETELAIRKARGPGRRASLHVSRTYPDADLPTIARLETFRAKLVRRRERLRWKGVQIRNRRESKLTRTVARTRRVLTSLRLLAPCRRTQRASRRARVVARTVMRTAITGDPDGEPPTSRRRKKGGRR